MAIRFTRFISASVLTLLLAACGTLKSPSQEQLIKDDYSLVIEYMSKFIKREMKRGDMTGLSIALIDDQKIVWSEGFGLADKSNERKAAPQTLYRAGSVSKLFTAIAVMQLVEAGKLNLDAPLVQYVPDFSLKSRFGSTDAITLGNTLSHHAGIPGNILDGMWSDSPVSFKSVAARLGDYYAAYPPNTVFAYSNAGYALAGHAIENVSGEAYTDYVEQHLLTQLGMSQSNFTLNVDDSQLAKSYWEGDEIREPGLRDIPAGGLVTNVLDLSRLVMAMHSMHAGNPGILQPNSFKRMITPAKLNSPYIIDNLNGLGFFVDPSALDGQFFAVGHEGQTMGHSASLVSIPELKLGVVILGNSPNLSGIYQKITKELLNVAYPVKTGKPLATPDLTASTPLPGTETTFDGDFVSPLGFLRITGEGPNYIVNTDGDKLSLKPDRDGDYRLAVKLLGFISVSPEELKSLQFHAREVGNQKIIVVESQGKRQLIATEAVAEPKNTTWHTYLGDYTVTNPIETDIDLFTFDEAVLMYEDGYYMFASKNSDDKSRLLLTIINENEATSQGHGRGLGETILVKSDGTLDYAGLILKRYVPKR